MHKEIGTYNKNLNIALNQSVDGLRGIASLNVTISHFVAAFMPSLLYTSYPHVFSQTNNPGILFQILNLPFVTIFFNGHFAVLIFFVLSGYVLAMPYFSGGENTSLILQKRLWARYLRLNIPIFAAIWISFTLYALNLYFNSAAADISGSSSWLKHYFYPGISPWVALKESSYSSLLLGNNAFVPPLWTLKVEFIGSVYLLLFYLIKPRDRLILPLLVCFFLIGIYHGTDSIYYMAIFCGSLLNLLRMKPTLTVMAFVLGFYLGAYQYHSIWYAHLPSASHWIAETAIDKTLYNTLGALLMTAAVINGFGKSFLETRLVQFLGKISFPLYLIHFSVLCSITCYLYLALPQGRLSLLMQFPLYIGICFAVAWLFEKTVDQPGIRISHAFSQWLLKSHI